MLTTKNINDTGYTDPKEIYKNLLLNNSGNSEEQAAVAIPKASANRLWKHISEIHKEAYDYIVDRRDGKIKSIRTPWAKFNEAGTGGLEWNTIVTIAGRPGSGKTLIVNQITRNAHKLNPTEDFAVLDLQFEMTSKSTGIREFSSVINKSYKEILSVDSKLPDEDLNKIWAHTKKSIALDIYQIDTPLTVSQIEREVKNFIIEVQKPTIVTLDHSILVAKSPGDKDKLDVLYDLGEKLTKMKKELPVMFIILTQMNRSIEELNRKVPGTVGNYPTTADVFGADALLQHSDLLAAINRPFLYNLDTYGPEQFEVTPNLLAIHFLKARNGENSLCFFEAEFKNMSIKEIPPPPTRKITLRSNSGTNNSNASRVTKQQINFIP